MCTLCLSVCTVCVCMCDRMNGGVNCKVHACVSMYVCTLRMYVSTYVRRCNWPGALRGTWACVCVLMFMYA